jgi:hypothetical protein
MLTANCPTPPALARRAIFSAMVALGVVLVGLSNEYGYHRDELYFRMLKPGWGYVDEPPLTPLIVHYVIKVADSPWAVRIPATLATMAAVLAVTLLARELGGSARAQGITAWGFAFGAIPLVMGHLMLTTSIDFAVWPIVVLFVVRTAVGNFARCRVYGRLDNDVGVDNEEQGEPIAICRDPSAPWTALWPRFQHYD